MLGERLSAYLRVCVRFSNVSLGFRVFVCVIGSFGYFCRRVWMSKMCVCICMFEYECMRFVCVGLRVCMRVFMWLSVFIWNR